jgi:hypothetical protein
MKKPFLVSILLLASVFVSLAANKHPSRKEVNERLARQGKRIKHKLAHRNMSEREAARLQRADHRVRREERNLASRHPRHLTSHERQRLNRQEDHISRQIAKH